MLHRLLQCKRTRGLRYLSDTRRHVEDSRWPGWQVVIGIETHAQIKSRRKLFSESFTPAPNDPPNIHVSAFDAAFPGTLPKLNQTCVDLAIRAALALNADIQTRSSFDRKHYFYSDLPSGYQITQQYAPIALNGHLPISLSSHPSPLLVRIKQIQLEQDTAKSTLNPRTRTSHIDLNRAGAGLMEIVSQPDLRSPEEAASYVRTLQALLRSIGSSDGNMEQGSMRCDVNVSINKPGEPPGTRCEIKNLNSVRFMAAAITHEIARQMELLTSTHSGSQPPRVPQETRGFDEHRFETYKLRSKEDAPDYRYMPDPNLGVLIVKEDRIEQIRKTLPELPWTTRQRLKASYDLKPRDIEVLLNVDGGKEVPFDGEVADGGAIAYFDQVCAAERDPRIVVNWMTHELIGQLTARKESFKENTVTAEQLGELIDMVQGGRITGTSGKLLLRHMLASPSLKPSSKIAQELHLTALSSSSRLDSPGDDVSESTTIESSTETTHASDSASSELDALVLAALSALPSETAAARGGNKNVLNKIVGRVMRDSRGRADAKLVKERIEVLMQKGN